MRRNFNKYSVFYFFCHFSFDLFIILVRPIKKNNISMKNLKKISKHDLKSISGGIEPCYYLADGTKICPCNYHTQYDCNGVCIPKAQVCL